MKVSRATGARLQTFDPGFYFPVVEDDADLGDCPNAPPAPPDGQERGRVRIPPDPDPLQQ